MKKRKNRSNNNNASKNNMINFQREKAKSESQHTQGHGGVMYRRKSQVEIVPRNYAQEDYVDDLFDYNTRITFAVGPAGTGKTLLAVLRAIKALKDREITRIVVTRPAVCSDEEHGFLPGDLNEKMAPWTRPIFDIFEEYWSPIEIAKMLEDRVIEVAPLAYMRGRTFKNAYILADEMQNATPDQMKMLLTRIGVNTYCCVTGDLDQHDRKFSENGLKDFVDRLERKSTGSVGITWFDNGDVERDPVVEEVLGYYGDIDDEFNEEFEDDE